MRALPESAIFLEGTLTPTPTATPTATATAKASRTIVLISLIVCAARFNILGFALVAFFSAHPLRILSRRRQRLRLRRVAVADIYYAYRWHCRCLSPAALLMFKCQCVP